MKLKSVLVFSVVIASLAFVAVADANEVEIGFEGGGRFDDFVGTGHTDGLADLSTGQAQFVFSGTVTDDDDDQGDDD